MPEGPLTGRIALVTGVSRPASIGFGVAGRLSDLGATVLATGWMPHDEEMPWGAAPAASDRFAIEEWNLEDPAAPAELIDAVVERFGSLDILVAAHARSADVELDAVTAEELDRCWAANVRSVVLLARRFAERRDPGRPLSRMIWFTSGQGEGPMPGQLPYAITKAALHQMTATMADALID